MAVTCEDILEIDTCRKMKFISGKNGLKRVVSWPYIKAIDNLSEWLYGDEMVFILNEQGNYKEEAVKGYLNEAEKANISAIVLLVDTEHTYEITEEAKRMSEEYSVTIFTLPYNQRLIDITRDISRLIMQDQIATKSISFDEDETILSMLLNGKQNEEILFHCFRKLQPLKDTDRVMKSELVKTLYMFLENGNDAARTSEKLFIHRNTMNGRMKKINSLLGTNMNDPKVRTEYMNVFQTLIYMGMEVF